MYRCFYTFQKYIYILDHEVYFQLYLLCALLSCARTSKELLSLQPKFEIIKAAVNQSRMAWHFEFIILEAAISVPGLFESEYLAEK